LYYFLDESYYFSDEDEEYKGQVQDLRDSIPFAVVGSSQMVEVNGKKIRGRQYPWGVVEVENPKHCDFVKIRSMLITHMQDLQEVTHDVHYENYRSKRLASKANGAMASNGNGATTNMDKDRALMEKEVELRKMQEMVAQMQQQIKQQSVTSLASLVPAE
jgi:septin 2